jgi:hypothetical protein
LDIKQDYLHWHPTLRIRYTSYDLCREEDYMNSNQDPCFVMVSTPGATPHPWRYAKVLRMFHVDTSFHNDAESKTVRSDILRVWWFETDHQYPFGAEHLQLERIMYLDRLSEDATGFIDPQMVIRTVHLQPAY